MGRFDALTQLDKQAPFYQEKPANPQAVLPTSPQTRKPAKNPLTKRDDEKPEKYTTRLKPSMVKRVKVFAAQQEIKDYEVVEKALVEYFEQHK